VNIANATDTATAEYLSLRNFIILLFSLITFISRRLNCFETMSDKKLFMSALFDAVKPPPQTFMFELTTGAFL
jgi:hypothetical protein